METRRAVVIGINKYEDDTIPELKGAENDATELHGRLVNQDSGGFDIAKEHFLTGKDATCDAIRHAISDLLWKDDSCDLSLFYFSGHGFHDGYGDGYIAPWDMLHAEPMVRGIRMRELTDLLLGAKMKKTVLMILDCCYSGIATEGKGDGPEKPPVDEWFSAFREDTGKGRIVLASGGKDEKSHELLTCTHSLAPEGELPHAHGLFTYYLLEALDGKAAGENDEITLDGLLKYIDSQMKVDSEQKPKVFNASMSLGMIRIARANQWRKILDSVQDVETQLAEGDPFEIFTAAQNFGNTLSNFATLPQAKDLKTRLDQKLSEYRGPALAWLMKKKFNFAKYRDVMELLTLKVGCLSVDEINNLISEQEFVALLEMLVSVSCLRANGQPYSSEDSFIYGLTGYANAQAHSASVATPETTGQGKVS